MRAASLLPFAVLALALSSGCSSSDPPATTPDVGKVNACVAIGGKCAVNYPFRCPPGYEAVTSGDLSTACGRSTPDEVPDVAPFDYACCILPYEPDTGAPETLDAADGDATDAIDGDATDVIDADATDAKDGDAADAPADVVDATDVADAVDG